MSFASLPFIKKLSTFTDLLGKTNAELFFIDIEQTLLQDNIFYELLEYNEFNNLLVGLCNGRNLSDVMYFGKNYKRKLMEPCIPMVLNSLKRQKKLIFALSSGYPSQSKKDRIIEYGIKLNGFLFTKRGDKGPFLVKFLQRNNLHGSCCFIDNHLEKIQNVQHSFFNYFPERGIDLLLYTKHIRQYISKQEFIRYWSRVIEAIDRGELIKLRERINKSRKY